MTKIFNTVLENDNCLGVKIGKSKKTLEEIINFFRKEIKEKIIRKIPSQKRSLVEKQLEDKLNWLENELNSLGDKIVSIEIELDIKETVNIVICPKK